MKETDARVVLKILTVECGEQFVMIPGTQMMQMLYVVSLDVGRVISAAGDAHFCEGSGNSLLDDVQCRGNEAYL